MTRHKVANLFRTLGLGLICVVPACNKGKEPAAAVPGPTSTPVAGAPDVPVVTSFGVPECDAYVEKYTSCLDEKVSPEAKQKLLESFEANRNKWRAMATMKESASALAAICSAATQKAKEELSVDYGCAF
jgi:hypothetical protein